MPTLPLGNDSGCRWCSTRDRARAFPRWEWLCGELGGCSAGGGGNGDAEGGGGDRNGGGRGGNGAGGGGGGDGGGSGGGTKHSGHVSQSALYVHLVFQGAPTPA
eukprot:6377360-Prymnesium_polylepis.1